MVSPGDEPIGRIKKRIGSGASTPEQAIVAQHMTTLRNLSLIPYAADYFAPQEILALLEYCIQYGVDASLFVGINQTQARNRVDGGKVRRSLQPLLVSRIDADGERVVEEVPCRMRLESGLLDDLDGVWVPDLDLKGAYLLVGELRSRITRELQKARQEK